MASTPRPDAGACAQWELVPSDADLDAVGERFAAANVLPSIRGLLRSIDTSFQKLPAPPPGGDAPLHIGQDAFLCVEQSNGRAGLHGSRHACAIGVLRPPRDATEVAPPLLVRLGVLLPLISPNHLRGLVDEYLKSFANERACAALLLLRTVNWITVPLGWGPRWTRAPKPTVSHDAATRAIARLIQCAADATHQAIEVVAEAGDLLHTQASVTRTSA